MYSLYPCVAVIGAHMTFCHSYNLKQAVTFHTYTTSSKKVMNYY